MVIIDVSKAKGLALDYLVAKLYGYYDYDPETDTIRTPSGNWIGLWNLNYTTDWNQGGPIIEHENITIIRADSIYIENKYLPYWFAETSNCVGHGILTSYEDQYFAPCFMIDEADGCYGPTPLIAAMRALVISKLGKKVEVPDEVAR